MRVTVLITSYNREEWIEKCLKSAINQTYNKELLTVAVIDDFSTDGSWKKICKFLYGNENAEHLQITGGIEFRKGEKDGVRVISVRPPRNTGGPSSARNLLIEITKSTTDAYQILDCDDEMYPQKVEKLVEALSLSQGVGAAYADYDILDVESGLTVPEIKRPFSQQLLLNENIVHSGSLVSKLALINCADEFGYFDKNMRTCEDYDLWIRISEKFTILHVAESLTLVRNHKDNSTNTVVREVWQRNWQRIREKIARRNVSNSSFQAGR